ncbi:MAG: VOC family protein [Nocardioides sp.]
MIGHVEKTVFDCADPQALASFYAEVLGMQVLEDEWNWVALGRERHMRELAFQKMEPYVPPQWPDTEHPQQLHLDIAVEDFDKAISAVTALGAVRRPGAPETGYRVFEDQAGHPFCLVHGRKVPDPRFTRPPRKRGSEAESPETEPLAESAATTIRSSTPPFAGGSVRGTWSPGQFAAAEPEGSPPIK